MMRGGLWIVFALLVVLAGCNRSRPAPDETPKYDRVSQGPQAPPQSVVNGTFSLRKIQKFAFDVPPHVIAPKVRGEFSSFTSAADGSKVSDESSEVEMMVMTDAQFDDFTHKRSAQSVDAIEPTHNHGVSISLPGTQDEVAHYFVVFQRAGETKAPISVKANIRAEFDASM